MAISFPILNRGLKVSGKSRTPGTSINYRGLRIYFAGDPERVYARQLLGGQLRFVALPDRLELWLNGNNGASRILGRVDLGPAGLLLHGSRPIADRNGPIKFLNGHHNARYVSADLLFPEFGKVRLYNHFVAKDYYAFVLFKNIEIILPVDGKNHWGTAAREGRIAAVANSQKIELFEKTREGREELIGTINIDDEGFILKNGIRYTKDGMPINIYDQRNRRQVISAVDLIESYAVKDFPVRFSKARERAEVRYKKVTFLFYGGPRYAFSGDLLEGVLSLRVGFKDRLEIIRKRNSGAEILATIKIDEGGFLLDLKGQRYVTSKGPVRLGEYRNVNIARLAGAFKPDEGAEQKERQTIESDLIWKYRYLVGLFARKYVGQGASEDELEDAGWEGLRKASRKYDEKRGYTFRTYARRWIMSEMQATIRRKKKEIWGGEDRARLIGTLRREERRFHQKNGYDPSDLELAESLGLTEKRVSDLRRSAARRVFSLQAPKNGNGELLWIDYLPDSSVINPEEEAIEREAQTKIEAALDSLDSRERYVLRAHYGDEELPLERIGEILGEAERGEALTRERVRQLKDRALNTVRENYPTLASYL